MMSDNKQDDALTTEDNIVSFRARADNRPASFTLNDVEAFCIETDEVFYISVVYRDRNGFYHSHGHAVFSSGEKVKFTIAVNEDETVRDKCLLAGQNIAKRFGAALMIGTIDEYGKFYQNTNSHKEEEMTCGKN